MKIFKKSYHSHCQSLRTQQVDKPLCVVGIFNMENEIWKDVIGYEGYYQASNYGNVRSMNRKVISKHPNGRIKTGRIIKQKVGKLGYCSVCLSQFNVYKSYLIHRIIAKLFILNPENRPQVNHKDGNKKNNSVENLEWCTCSENMIHAYKIGIHKGRGKNKSKNLLPSTDKKLNN